MKFYKDFPVILKMSRLKQGVRYDVYQPLHRQWSVFVPNLANYTILGSKEEWFLENFNRILTTFFDINGDILDLNTWIENSSPENLGYIKTVFYLNIDEDIGENYELVCSRVNHINDTDYIIEVYDGIAKITCETSWETLFKYSSQDDIQFMLAFLNSRHSYKLFQSLLDFWR